MSISKPRSALDTAARLATGSLTEADLAAVNAIVDHRAGLRAQALRAAQVREKAPEGFEKLESLVRAQYSDSLALLIRRGLYLPESPDYGGEDLQVPSLNEVLTQLQTELSKDQVAAILAFKDPVFDLVPVKAFPTYIKAIDENKNHELDQVDTFQGKIFQERMRKMDEKDSAGKEISRWDIAISGAPQETGTIHPRVYALRQMAGIDQVKPMDSQTAAVLDDGLTEEEGVPYAIWAVRRLDFHAGNVTDSEFGRSKKNLYPSVILKGPGLHS